MSTEYLRLPDKIKKTKINTYRGELKVKKAHIKLSMTKEYLEEYIRCKNDPIYFIKSYVKTKMLDSPKHEYFELYDYQEELINNILDNRLSIGMLARQMGKTVTVCALIIWMIVFNNNFKTEIVSYVERDAKKALKIAKDMYENLPFWMQHGVESWGTINILLDNGSSIDAKASSGSRGGSLNFLYIDELAFIQNGEEFWASVYPTIESGTESKISITSTPKGMNFFHTLWSEYKTNGFSRFYQPYYKNPKRATQEYRERTKRAVGQKTWMQEYECKFAGSSDTLISGEMLEKLEHKTPIRESDNGKHHTRIFELPKKDSTYLIACDVAEGVGGDASTIQVINIDTLPFRQVYSYSSSYIDPMTFADKVNKVGRSYNNGLVIVERNNLGHTTLSTLESVLNYPNLLYTFKNVFESKGDNHAGIRMTTLTKPIGCILFKVLVESGYLEIYDLLTIKEAHVFEKIGNKFSAIRGYKDDLIMAFVNLALALILEQLEDLLPLNFPEELQKKMQEIYKKDLDGEDADDVLDDADDVLEENPIEDDNSEYKDRYALQADTSMCLNGNRQTTTHGYTDEHVDFMKGLFSR